MLTRFAWALVFASAVLVFVGIGALSSAELAVGLAAAILAAATLYFQLTGQRPLAPAPGLVVKFEITGAGTMFSEHGLSTLDTESVIDSERRIAAGTIPQPKPARTGFDLAIGGLASGAFEKSRSTAIAELEQEFATYEGELREWLGEYSKALWLALTGVQVRVVVENTGRVHAEDVEVEVQFGRLLTPAIDKPIIGRPPLRPRYTASLLSAAHFFRVNDPRVSLDPSTSIVDIGDRRELTWRPGRILHAKADAVGPVELLVPPELGGFEIHWLARAGNMRSPTSGSIALTFAGPEHEPFTTMDELRAFSMVRIDG